MTGTLVNLFFVCFLGSTVTQVMVGGSKIKASCQNISGIFLPKTIKITVFDQATAGDSRVVFLLAV